MLDTIFVGIGAMAMLFVGIGAMAMFFVISYLLYQLVRVYKCGADVEEKICLFQEMTIDKLASAKGFDLNKEVEKRSIMNKKSFRKLLEKQMVEEIFGKDEKRKKV